MANVSHSAVLTLKSGDELHGIGRFDGGPTSYSFKPTKLKIARPLSPEDLKSLVADLARQGLNIEIEATVTVPNGVVG